MSRTVAIIQARIASTRLPGKVLFELAGRPMIAVMLARLRRSERLDRIVVATGDRPENDALAAVVDELGVPVFRGPEDDVLARYAGASAAHGADVIVRLTADCPLMDPEVVDRVAATLERDGLDFCTNVLPPSWPDGLDISVFTRAALDAADRQATLPSEREHVVPWMWRHSTLFGGSALAAANVAAGANYASHRWTVDEAADFRMMRALARELGAEGLVTAGYREILASLEAKPEIARLNMGLARDEGLTRSQVLEKRSSK